MTALEREFDARPLVRAGLLILSAGIFALGGWAAKSLRRTPAYA